MDEKQLPPGLGPVAYKPAERQSAERDEAESILRDIDGVRGVGEGRDDSGAPAWLAYVTDTTAASRLPAQIGQRRVLPLVSGEISARPASGENTGS
jgi:hypothetical protein